MTEQTDNQPGTSGDLPTDASLETPATGATSESTPVEAGPPPLEEDETDGVGRSSDPGGSRITEPQTADQAPRPRPKPDPVRSLVDLFTVKGANAKGLLRELEKQTSWKFDEEDVEAALRLVPERDAHLVRTRQLLHEAIEAREGRFAHAAGDFAVRAVGADINGLESWPPGEDTEPIAALRELTERLAPDLRHPRTERRSHNLLMIAVDLLSHRRSMAFETAAPVLRQAIGRPPEYERNRSNPRRHRVASVTLPRNDLQRVRDLLDLLEPWEREVEKAKQATHQAAGEALEASRAAAEAQQQAGQLAAETAALRAQLQSARQDAEASRDRVQDVRIRASADVTELRARTVAFLNTRLRDLVATAKEASEVDPPRTATSVRLLEQALQELRKEVEWLRSSA